MNRTAGIIALVALVMMFMISSGSKLDFSLVGQKSVKEVAPAVVPLAL